MIHHVDNEAARYAVIKGTSPTLDSALLMAAFWKEDSERRAFSWFERFPSPTMLPPDKEDLGLCAKGLRTGSNPDESSSTAILVTEYSFLGHCFSVKTTCPS